MTENKTPFFEKFSNKVTQVTGTSGAFAIAALMIIIWAVAGPFFHFSETWQLVINTGTTIVTFLMVFLIQKSQNKDSKAIQLKLNELVASVSGASNRMVNIEDLNENQLDELHKAYVKLVESRETKENDIKDSKSVEDTINDLEHHVEDIEEKVEDIEERVDDISEKMEDGKG